jgi:hypothetical protein
MIYIIPLYNIIVTDNAIVNINNILVILTIMDGSFSIPAPAVTHHSYSHCLLHNASLLPSSFTSLQASVHSHSLQEGLPSLMTGRLTPSSNEILVHHLKTYFQTVSLLVHNQIILSS